MVQFFVRGKVEYNFLNFTAAELFYENKFASKERLNSGLVFRFSNKLYINYLVMFTIFLFDLLLLRYR